MISLIFFYLNCFTISRSSMSQSHYNNETYK